MNRLIPLFLSAAFISCCPAAPALAQEARPPLVLTVTAERPLPPRFCVVRGTRVVLEGKLGPHAPDLRMQLRDLGKVLANCSADSRFRLSWDTSEASDGDHSLRLWARLPTGAEDQVSHAVVTVIARPPAAPAADAILTGGEQSLHVEVRADHSVGLEPESITLSVDGVDRARLRGDAREASLSISDLKAGTHSAGFMLRYTGGAQLVLNPVEFAIPFHVRIAPLLLASVDVTDIGDEPTIPTIPIVLDVDPGLKLASVELFANGKTLGHASPPLFSQVTLDPKGRQPGPCLITGKATTESGREIDIAPRSIEIVRDLEREARASNIVHAKFTLKSLRRAFADSEQGPRPPRTGSIGSTMGLAVVTSSLKNRLTGRETILNEYGSTLHLEAILTPGNGRTNFLAFAEEETRVAAQVAAEWAKLELAALGRPINLASSDIVVAVTPANLKLGGPSGGAGNALVIISAALGLPVDNSVAITGTVDLHGNVGAVGGIDLKAEAAFSNASIRTLIVPATAGSVADIRALFNRRPSLFIDRRIIYARSMEQVMRQALIGFDPTYDEARKLIRMAKLYFAAGKDDEALTALEAAKKITPEDTTVDLWLARIQTIRADDEAVSRAKP